MDNQQQYKWRQRKKKNTRITIWIVLVVILSALATFIYEGRKTSDPLNVAQDYIKQTVGVDQMDVEAGDRSLNSDNQFVQDYTVKYTADGKEVTQKVSMVQQAKKRFGLFDQWTVQTAGADKTDMELIVPTGLQVLIDGVAPSADSIKADDTLSAGVVCYELKGVDRENSVLQVNGLPFESYTGSLEGDSTVLDIRDQLTVSENAQTQMEEIGKSMINELYNAAIAQEGAEKLGSDFDKVANKANLYKAISENLFDGDNLKISSINFEGFEPTFGEITYPGKDEESYLAIDMTLKYTCTCELAEGEAETEETTEETETESAATGTQKEAKFSFRYQDGNCIVTSAEIPGAV